jgi:malonate-semialdehyde dehydrogenase (acetylating)/methylmalonate-semialdehyde dehydrogenase
MSENEHDPTLEAVAEGRLGHWIDGGLVHSDGTLTSPIHDPARGIQTGEVPLADVATVDTAVRAAASAFPGWRDTPLSRRMPILYRLREAVVAHTDELAAAIASQHGKVVADAAGEVQRGIEILELACSAPVMLKGEFSEQVAGGIDTFSIRQPLGVCAGITPFNFPAMVPLWMFPVAIACGNTFVLKPSERDPAASMMLARLAIEAGLPPGVLNVVHGDKVAVDALLDHPDVAAVSFVGSTPIARYVYGRAAAAGKRVQALGGAKNHLVVLPDADLEQAADALVSSAFGSAGQRCMAISIGVAVGNVGDDLIEAVATRTASIKVGPASESDSEMGPLVTAEARDRVRRYADRGVAEGAKLVEWPGQVSSRDDGGFFVDPVIFDRVEEGMGIYEDEVFGPLLGFVRVGNLDDALDLIARNAYGNGAAIFTRSGRAARRFQREVAAGMVGVNVPIPVPVGYYSFGGWGDSLFGDTHLYGPEGFHFYTRGKVVTSRWPADEVSEVTLAFPAR